MSNQTLFTLSAQGGTLPNASLFEAFQFMEQLRNSSGHDSYIVRIDCHIDGSACEITVPAVHAEIDSDEWAAEIMKAEDAVNQGILFLVSMRQ